MLIFNFFNFFPFLIIINPHLIDKIRNLKLFFKIFGNYFKCSVFWFFFESSLLSSSLIFIDQSRNVSGFKRIIKLLDSKMEKAKANKTQNWKAPHSLEQHLVQMTINLSGRCRREKTIKAVPPLPGINFPLLPPLFPSHAFNCIPFHSIALS